MSVHPAIQLYRSEKAKAAARRKARLAAINRLYRKWEAGLVNPKRQRSHANGGRVTARQHAAA